MKNVLVTGCSSGFGLASALAFARAGYRVFGTTRSAERAAPLAAAAAAEQLPLSVLAIDVAAPDGPRALLHALEAGNAGVDVLINNAGMSVPGALEDLTDADIEAVMAVNFLAPLRLSRAVLPGMRAAGGGRILMLSSLSARVGLPGEGIYAAAKAALEAASESLRHEVARFNVHVSVVEPGLFETAMPAKLLAGWRCPAGSVYAPLVAFLRAGMQARAGQGDDPRRLAQLLLSICAEAAPAFRYSAGEQARAVTARLAALPDAARDDLVREVAGTRWWSDGEAAPD